MNVQWARHSEKKLRAQFLPASDNTSEALAALQAAKLHYRNAAWPAPFNATKHRLHKGDARDLSWIPDNSVHLVVTSPPYWTLKKYEEVVVSFAKLLNMNRFWRNWIGYGGSACGSSKVGAFVVLSETFAFLGSGMGAIA
jgi:hypothetical protein